MQLDVVWVTTLDTGVELAVPDHETLTWLILN